MTPALQISIPRTSVSTPLQGKPYTQYHVVLQLPLRREESKKRYSDFTELHQQLTSQTSTAPPAPLPGKSWFTRTVNNDTLTEERRSGLERYLQAIITADDGKWRSSKAWRAFMNLPDASTIDAGGNLTASNTKSTGINSSQWLDTHRGLKTNMQTIRHQLKQREAATSVQQQHALSAEAKASLVRATGTIQQLESALPELGKIGDLGDGELRRRKDLVVAARKEVQGLEGILRSSISSKAAVDSTVSPDAGKEALWKGTSTGKPGRVLGPAKETARTRELDNNGVLQLQQQIMQEQDEDVESLAKTVNKLKDMGIMINEELVIQNEMLGLVEQDVDRVQGKIDVGRSRIKKIK